MIHFSEDLVGGFFGFYRTYGAVARFEYDAIEVLEADWPTALTRTQQWRATRKDRATALHLYFEGPPALRWDAIAFVKSRVLVPPAALPAELQGLALEVAVFGAPDMELYLDLKLYREATSGPFATSEMGEEG
jgi:hypothetical protein